MDSGKHNDRYRSQDAARIKDMMLLNIRHTLYPQPDTQALKHSYMENWIRQKLHWITEAYPYVTNHMQTIIYKTKFISIPLTDLNSYGCCESMPEKFNTKTLGIHKHSIFLQDLY